MNIKEVKMMDADRPEEAASILCYLKSYPKSVFTCNL